MSEGVLQLCLSRGWGGLEMYPTRIARPLGERGWRVYGAGFAGTRVSDELRGVCIEVLEFRSMLQALRRVYRLKRWMQARNIRVVHCHKSSDLRLAALLKLGMPSLRVVFTEHMGGSKPKRDLYHRWAYARVDQVLAISQATLARNRRALPVAADRLSLLYQGLDLTQHPASIPAAQRQALRASLGLEPEDIAVALAARLTPGKGHHVWLEALAKLPPESPVRGLIIGGTTAAEGSDEAFVAGLKEKIRTLGLGSRVSFTGYRGDLPTLLPALDIACVPSPNEAFGLAAIEAMAASRPVVGSNSGALPETLGADAGVLVEAGNSQAWCDTILALAADGPRRAALGARARRRVETHFELGRHLDALSTVYMGKSPAA